MATEITYLSGLQVTKSPNIKIDRRPGAKQADMAGDDFTQGVMSVPTAAAGTAIPMGLVGTAGLAHFKNMDLANFLEIGSQTGGATFHSLVKIKAGEEFTFRLGINNPFARSDAAACKMEYIINED